MCPCNSRHSDGGMERLRGVGRPGLDPGVDGTSTGINMFVGGPRRQYSVSVIAWLVLDLVRNWEMPTMPPWLATYRNGAAPRRYLR